MEQLVGVVVVISLGPLHSALRPGQRNEAMHECRISRVSPGVAETPSVLGPDS